MIDMVKLMQNRGLFNIYRISLALYCKICSCRLSHHIKFKEAADCSLSVSVQLHFYKTL